jgi:hypothetical protein
MNCPFTCHWLDVAPNSFAPDFWFQNIDPGKMPYKTVLDCPVGLPAAKTTTKDETTHLATLVITISSENQRQTNKASHYVQMFLHIC